MRANTLNLLKSASRHGRVGPAIWRAAPCAARWSSTSSRQWSTPLAKSLAEAITTTGPVSVASYMRQCLTSPDGGYYTRLTAGRDQFGAKGDFITSPEISQVFGELVGIWLYTEWLAQGRKSGVQIIEVGPGRGTLMADVLRTIQHFKPFAQAIEAIYLVEASPHLREQQAKLLCSPDSKLDNVDIGQRSKCSFIPGCDITWCEDIKFVPKDASKTPFILAHEFFDALPIHVFQNIPSSQIPRSSTIITPTGPITPKTGPHTPQNQWHELVVSPATSNPSSNLAGVYSKPSASGEEKPEFQLTVSKTPTPHSLFLPQTSERYKALSKTENAIIEISPDSLAVTSDFATRIGGSNPPSSPSPSSPSSALPKSSSASKDDAFEKPTPSGAALILDYGPSSTIPANTLRGIRAHRTCSPFVSPGDVDLSADVDFLALAETAINASPGVEVHGPVTQAFFLSSLGIEERAERLLKSASAKGMEKESEEGMEKLKRIESGVKRLIDKGPTGMGKLYKAMAIVPCVPGKEGRRPVGFGGSVVGL